MTHEKLLDLISTGSAPIGPAVSIFDEPTLSLGKHVLQLLPLIQKKNGFFAFESALHVYPLDESSEFDLDRWNNHQIWKEVYWRQGEKPILFAQDAFGMQFGLRSDGISVIDTETGNEEFIAKDIEQWAGSILDDYDFRTGYSLAHHWQEKNGPLPLDCRLAPRKPFVLGGEYTVENLYAVNMYKLLEFRALLFGKIENLPDGERVKLNTAV